MVPLTDADIINICALSDLIFIYFKICDVGQEKGPLVGNGLISSFHKLIPSENQGKIFRTFQYVWPNIYEHLRENIKYHFAGNNLEIFKLSLPDALTPDFWP